MVKDSPQPSIASETDAVSICDHESELEQDLDDPESLWKRPIQLPYVHILTMVIFLLMRPTNTIYGMAPCEVQCSCSDSEVYTLVSREYVGSHTCFAMLSYDFSPHAQTTAGVC